MSNTFKWHLNNKLQFDYYYTLFCYLISLEITLVLANLVVYKRSSWKFQLRRCSTRVHANARVASPALSRRDAIVSSCRDHRCKNTTWRRQLPFYRA